MVKREEIIHLEKFQSRAKSIHDGEPHVLIFVAISDFNDSINTVITQSNDIPANKVDAKSLAALIVELNISRRNCLAYPKGHPIIAASLTKVLRAYEELLSKHDEVILGVTSDTLMMDGNLLEKSNVVYRDFSRVLFERGIGALVFQRGLTIEELNNFAIILALKREQIQQHGGIEQVWAKARIAAMTIRPIRYDLFKTTDEGGVSADLPVETGENLWDRFARELTLGELPPGSSSDIYLDPEILAEVLNQSFSSGTITETAIRKAITDFLAPADFDSSSGANSGHPYQKMAALISDLTPELRRKFLDSLVGTNSRNRQAAVEHVLTNLSDNVLLETIEDVNKSRLDVSPVVFRLLQRLRQNVSSTTSSSANVAEDDDLSSKMKDLLREHASEEFVPDDYQQKLNYIISSDQIPRLNMEEVTDLLGTLENRSIEYSVTQILTNLIREGSETPRMREMLLQNLCDMFGFFLQTGDYGQLHLMVDQLTDGTYPIDIQYRLRDEYCRREFLEEILDGLSIWGKPRYDDIRTLIHKIGAPFVDAILDRLSEEKNMSLRRFYMDSLIEMGPVTRVPIVNRLYDKRWYFIRNLLIILSAQNIPDVIELIRPLLKSEDPRLRHEVLKTLVHFRDTQAEKKVLEDLDSRNPELQATAIQLAERCASRAIATKLAVMLSQGGFSQIECDRKSALVRALGEIGQAEALPELAKILRSRSLFKSRQLTKLKTDIIRSLPKYPPNVAIPVLEHIASGSGEIARLAAETKRMISGKHT